MEADVLSVNAVPKAWGTAQRSAVASGNRKNVSSSRAANFTKLDSCRGFSEAPANRGRGAFGMTYYP